MISCERSSPDLFSEGSQQKDALFGLTGIEENIREDSVAGEEDFPPLPRHRALLVGTRGDGVISVCLSRMEEIRERIELSGRQMRKFGGS